MGGLLLSGEDFKKGTVLLRAGTKLDFVEIGILASMGVAEVPVRRRARVAILTTGDEVMIPGEQLKQGKIYDCNQSLLAARLMDFRGRADSRGQESQTADDEGS